VEYTDDGCSIYQCLWCKCTFETRDNPEYQWNFCPKCGRSWFKKADCRPRNIPRWAWDRGIREYQEGLYPPWKEDKQVWFIEWRTRWEGEEWGEWRPDGKVYGNDWQSAARQLAYRREGKRPDDVIQHEYRARIKHEH
jgi:hypothetical protein